MRCRNSRLWRLRSLIGFLSFALALLAPGVSAVEKLIRAEIVTDYSVEDPAFRESIADLLRAPLVPGNKITTLVNGDQIFPEMVKAIRSATNSITMENFIWRSGILSDLFIKALAERARAGVKVFCIIDGMGGFGLRGRDREKMRQAGIQLEIFSPVRWYNFLRWNHRTHRKLMVVDGRVGFIGGICIADEWLGNAQSPPLWRDTEYRVDGPLAGQMQGVFMDNWIRTRSEVPHGTHFFPVGEAAGDTLAQCFKSGPQDGAENARLLYLYSIAAARKSIRLSHSYFVPDNLAIQMLVAACARGVKVEIITPGIIDWSLVRHAARARFGKLIEAGVEFYEYQPAKYHCKAMIVDDIWVTAGSINFDDRSFRINDEANINVYDREFASEQIRIFEEDKAKSRRVTLQEHRRRGWFKRCLESFAALFRGQL